MKLRLNLCAGDVDVYVSLVVLLRALLEAIWTPRIMNLTQWRSQSFSSIWELFRCFISLYSTSSACTYNSWHNQQSMYEDENVQIQILQICGKEFFSSIPVSNDTAKTKHLLKKYMFKVNYRNTKTMYEVWSKLPIKTLKWHHR